MSSLLIETRGHVTLFTLNQPDKHNAYDEEMAAAIAEGFEAFEADPEQYVAIVTGAGDKAFCSGTRLGAGGDRGDAAAGARTRRQMASEHDMTDMFGIGAVSKPVIAAVNGLAVGGGTEIALASDIRIAADTAWFGLYETKRGIIPGVAVHLLPRMVTYGDAALMLLAAEPVSAEEALRIGLVQRVVPAADLLDEANRLADQICALSQNSVRTLKRIMRFHRDALLREGVNFGEAMRELMRLGGDVAEGMQAFAEKRTADFANRWAGT